MATEKLDSSVGSAVWIGADDYEPGEVFHRRATEFLKPVKWDQLASISSGLRGGISCSCSEKFSVGHFNMVRRIDFADQKSWVARVRLPSLNAVFGDREKLDIASTMKVEVSSMKFLKSRTTIPVPEVHSYDFDSSNGVGAPYILMDYIDGTIATKLQQLKECAVDFFGTADQDRKFRQQMADIQAKLSSFTFAQIGSLYQDEQTKEFYIGPELETGKGPWNSPLEYFSDLTNHALQACLSSNNSETQEVQEGFSFTLPIVFRHLISLYGCKDPTSGPFRLTNRDFGAHNLLVNDEFEVIGVIDLDGVMAAPIEVVAQYPIFSGLEREAPGHVETRPLAIERIKRTKPRLEEYKDLLKKSEDQVKEGYEGDGGVADYLLSDSSSIFQGLKGYGLQKSRHDKWMTAYIKLLQKKLRSGEP